MSNVFKNRVGYGVGMQWRRGPYRELVDNLRLALDASVTESNSGFVPYNMLWISANPSATDTVTIGTNVYEFRGAAGEMSNDAYIAVRIAGTAEATLDNLVMAINGTGSITTSANGVLKNGGGAPALVVNGALSIKAEKHSTTHLRVFPAVLQGGDKVADVATTLACSASLATTKTWDFSNMTATVGIDDSTKEMGVARIPVTTAMIANGFTIVEFPFTVAGFVFTPLTSSGAAIAGQAGDTVAIASGKIKVTFGGGFDNGDVIHFLAWS